MKLSDHELMHELLEENERLRQLLEDIEWVQPISNSSQSCSCCGNMRHWGHEPECTLAQTIGSKEIKGEEAYSKQMDEQASRVKSEFGRSIVREGMDRHILCGDRYN